MKKPLIFLLISLCTLPASAQLPDEYNDNGIDRELCRKNKIKNVAVYERMFIGKIPCGRRHLLFSWDYNSNGQQTYSHTRLGPLIGSYDENKKYDSLGNDISDGKKYVYDEQGRILMSAKDENDSKYVYRYNAQGKVSTRKFYWFGALNSNGYFLDTFHYNSENKVVLMERFRANGSLYFDMRYEYDSIGRLVKSQRSENGRVTDVDVYDYDEKGRLVASDHFNRDTQKRSMWYTIRYNEKDLPSLEWGQLNEARLTYRRKYVYTFYE